MTDQFGFDLGDAPISPLDLQGLNPTIDRLQGAQSAQPTQPTPTDPADRKRSLALAALIPIIAQRGGRVGVAAFLQGIQQAQDRKQKLARQSQLDAQAQQTQQATQDFRNRQLTDQERQRQAVLDAAAAKQREAGNVTGMRQMSMDALNQGTDPQAVARQMYAETGQSLPAGVVPPKPTAPNTGSFEDYVRRTYGETPTSAQILEARKAYNQADDRPRITVNTGTTDPQALPPRLQAQVSSVAKSFDSLPIVKNIQKQAEAVAFAEGMNPNTKNPADDQGLIYAFAKAMDPDSVVREGEYDTVQKYAQSWLQSFGFNAQRVFSNSEFLTPQARANMKATIRQRYQAGLGQYNNVRTSFASRINKLTRKGDGADYLTDYGAGFPGETAAPPPSPSGGAPKGPQIGERRKFGDKFGVWDGKGWAAEGAQ